MRIYTSTLVTFLVTLMILSGTIGCKSNGGPWYNPKSYTWTGFPKSAGVEKGREAEAFAGNRGNAKPSLETQPSVSTPPSGYTSGGYVANNNDDSRFHGQNSYSIPVTSESRTASPAPYGGYSVASDNAVSSPYPSSIAQTSAALPVQTAQPSAAANYQYPGDAASLATNNTGIYQGQSFVPTSATAHAQPVGAYQTAPATPNSYSPYDASASVNYGQANPVPQTAPAGYGAAEQLANPYAAGAAPNGYQSPTPASY
ncbi:hypothetical protein FACS189443_6030 [Planctomycetales bacterium]|nr:hypothetical protein FACS189443_6030 [Planctomycetales bacterium]